MGLLPENHAERISWFQSRIAIWTTNQSAIGTTTAAITDVSTKADAAAAALEAQETAQNAAKAATATLLDAMEALTNSGMIVIEQVRTKSRTSGDGVFPLANIPAPATPAPKPAPGKSTDLVVTLDETGILNLKWKCPNPAGTSGTTYNIFRRVGAVTNPFEYIGGVGAREFVDDTLPAGSVNVVYKIQAVRSTAVGPWATFNVNFGVDGSGGMMMASVTDSGETTPPKMAA